MAPDRNGTWTASAEGDLDGVFYTYRVLRDNAAHETADPYARACGINGRRSMVLNLKRTDPEGWEYDTDPNAGRSPADCVIYETHIRDISADPDSGIRCKGRFLGLSESGTRTSLGISSGLDHIRKLGVTHVHLLPVFDFGSVDECAENGTGYNWGYDPQNFNIPEGSYATNAYDGYVRIREFKQLVQSLHKSGLSVVMDVVYNHVYDRADFCVNRLLPGYFSRIRRGRYSNASGCGNDTASERSMVRKYIVDSIRFWTEEYHIDGFRFDLAGLLDVDTIGAITHMIHKRNPNALLYGEGWPMPTVTTKEHAALAVQQNAWMLPGFSFFNDRIRDLVRGSVFSIQEPGFASGSDISREEPFECFCGRAGWTSNPKQIINFVACHDNHTLHDRIALTLPHADEHEIARRCRLAAAFNILSAGIPFLHSGEEMLRSKRDCNGNFVENSYSSGDSVNALQYASLARKEAAVTCLYYRGLLEVRRQHAAYRLSDPDVIRRSVTILDADDLYAFCTSTNGEILLTVFNPHSRTIPLTLPAGHWRPLVWDDHADIPAFRRMSGTVDLPPVCTAVFAATA